MQNTLPPDFCTVGDPGALPELKIRDPIMQSAGNPKKVNTFPGRDDRASACNVSYILE